MPRKLSDPWTSDEFFEVAVGARSGEQVRIRMRASDLYIVGWYTRANVYNYIGPGSEAGIPSTHRSSARNWQASKAVSYDQLERDARTTRSRINFNQNNVAQAARVLLDANDRVLMVGSILLFTQFIAEATRFRGISDQIGYQGYGGTASHNDEFTTHIPGHLLGQENLWARLSERFNWMLENRARDSERNAFIGYYLNAAGVETAVRLLTLAQYALVLNMAHGFPGRRS